LSISQLHRLPKRHTVPFAASAEVSVVLCIALLVFAFFQLSGFAAVRGKAPSRVRSSDQIPLLEKNANVISLK